MIHRFPTPQATISALAERFVSYLSSLDGVIRVVLPGGSTPRHLYQILVREPFHSRIPWSRIRWVLSDERCVDPGHRDSNFAMVWESLWRHGPVNREHIIRFKGELPPLEAVGTANQDLWEWERSDPLFHLVLLGVGEDGHTASIFPSRAKRDFGTSPVAHVFHPQKGDRLTLTPDALKRTQALWFFALGKGKAKAIQDSWSAQEGSSMHPIRLLPLEKSRWFLDEGAAGLLSGDIS